MLLRRVKKIRSGCAVTTKPPVIQGVRHDRDSLLKADRKKATPSSRRAQGAEGRGQQHLYHYNGVSHKAVGAAAASRQRLIGGGTRSGALKLPRHAVSRRTFYEGVGQLLITNRRARIATMTAAMVPR